MTFTSSGWWWSWSSSIDVNELVVRSHAVFITKRLQSNVIVYMTNLIISIGKISRTAAHNMHRQQITMNDHVGPHNKATEMCRGGRAAGEYGGLFTGDILCDTVLDGDTTLLQTYKRLDPALFPLIILVR